MAEIVMPQLGESVTEGTITRWFKEIGEDVAEDEPLFEVSTDKVDTEVPAPSGGVLTEIRVQEGDTVDVGTVLAVVGADGAAATTAEAPEPEATPEPEPAPAAESEPEPAAEPRRIVVVGVNALRAADTPVGCHVKHGPSARATEPQVPIALLQPPLPVGLRLRCQRVS